VLFMGAKGVLGGSAAALGHPRLVSKANVLALPVTGMLLCLPLPRFGLMGVAIAGAPPPLRN
jgi:O-antigen/teichoic acid export membrane protein